MKDTPEEGHISPVWLYGYYPGFRAPWEEWMVFQLRLSVAAAPPSIQTPRDSIRTWWARMENQSGGYGDNRESNVQMLGTTQTGNLQWWRGFLFLLSNPAHPLASPSSLTALYHSALPPDRPRHLPHSLALSLSPLFLVSIHIITWRTEAEIEFVEGNGWETCLNWGWNVIYDFPEVQQICRWPWICCCAQGMLKALRLASVYLTSLLTVEMSLCYTYL